MARPVRLDLPDSFYHVLSRGNERRRIFYGTADYQRFVELLGQTVEKFSIEVHAYVLMPNHYHLLLRTRYENLSRAIQWLGVSYAVWFNRKHNRSGHLFQGRFKNLLIEDEQYFTALCLYTHGNPLRAHLVEGLADYRWSSYRGYLDTQYRPSWLTTDLLLSLYGTTRSIQRAHEAYLGTKSPLFQDIHYGLCLGTKDFADDCLKKLKAEKHPEKPQTRHARRDLKTSALTILRTLGEKEPDQLLMSRRRAIRPTRDVALYILTHLGVFTNKSIGEVFGIGYTAVTEAVKRAASLFAHDKRLQQKVQRILIDF